MSSPESTFVTLCVRDPEATSPAELRAAAAAVENWEAVLDLAVRHRTLAYVHRGITIAEVSLPTDVHRRLGRLVLGAAQQVTRLQALLLRIAQLLASNDVPLLVLKGPVLGPTLYPSPVFRPFADLDLLVPEEHGETAAAALGRCGLVERPFEPEVARLEHAGHTHDGAAYHRMFWSADGGELVELHVDALQLGVRLSPEQGRWERAIPAPCGQGVLMLSWADQLIQLAVHAQKHGFNRLIWLKDLDLLIRQRRDEVDWEVAVEIARSEGVSASVWFALELVQRMLGTPVPQAWLRQLRPAAPMRAIYRCVWPMGRILALDGHMRRRAVQFHVADSWRGMLPSFVLLGRRRTRGRAIISAVLR
jgi:hypothetical protein